MRFARTNFVDAGRHCKPIVLNVHLLSHMGLRLTCGGDNLFDPFERDASLLLDRKRIDAAAAAIPNRPLAGDARSRSSTDVLAGRPTRNKGVGGPIEPGSLLPDPTHRNGKPLRSPLLLGCLHAY